MPDEIPQRQTVSARQAKKATPEFEPDETIDELATVLRRIDGNRAVPRRYRVMAEAALAYLVAVTES